MKHYKIISGICITALLFFTPLTFSQLAPQVKEVKSSILLSGLLMNVTNSIRENKEQILAGIRKAFHEGADFLVTPEGSLSGYTSNFNQSEVASALEEINVAQENEKINAQSGLIDSNGERSLRVPDSGSQFFTARIQNLARWQ